MWIIVTRIVVNSGLSIVLEKQVGAQEFCVCVSYFASFHLLTAPSAGVGYFIQRGDLECPPPLFFILFLASFIYFLFSKWPA